MPTDPTPADRQQAREAIGRAEVTLFSGSEWTLIQCVAAALATARAEGRDAQLRADCAAVCCWCRHGEEPKRRDDLDPQGRVWSHFIRSGNGGYREWCEASALREAAREEGGEG